jgi:hypothetical protein
LGPAEVAAQAVAQAGAAAQAAREVCGRLASPAQHRVPVREVPELGVWLAPGPVAGVETAAVDRVVVEAAESAAAADRVEDPAADPVVADLAVVAAEPEAGQVPPVSPGGG